MNLSKLSDQNLNAQLKSLVQSEREILVDILWHIREVDSRRLYLKMGYESLFAYLTLHIGYANGCAQRRLDAARLSIDVPDVMIKIESGELNLSQTTLVQKAVREVFASTKSNVDAQTKEKLINDISDKSVTETEILLAQTLNIQPKEATKAKHQKDESVRLEVTLSKAQWEKMLKMRELLSHSIPSGTWDQVLEYVSDKVIQQKDKTRTAEKARKPKTQSANNTASDTPKAEPARKHIPVAIQRQIFQQNPCCQYADKITGHKCESRWQLSIDHIQPIWAGGTNDPENLRILCAKHNREIYRWQSGVHTEELRL